MENKKKEIGKIKKLIPNIISTARILSVIPVCGLYMTGHTLAATFLLAGSCLTDFIDGKLARLWHVESKYGKYADAVGDKILMIPVILMHFINTFSLGLESILMSSMFLLEGTIGITNIYTNCIKKKEVNSVLIGKIKSAVLMITVILSMASLSIGSNIFSLITNIGAPITTIILQLLSLKEYVKNIQEDECILSPDVKESKLKEDDIDNKLSKSLDLTHNKNQNQSKNQEIKSDNNKKISELLKYKNLLLNNEKENINNEKSKKIGQKSIKNNKNIGNK